MDTIEIQIKLGNHASSTVMDCRGQTPLLGSNYNLFHLLCLSKTPTQPGRNCYTNGPIRRIGAPSGRYDDAVRVVQDWMSLHQDNPSQVEFLHIEIAVVYTSKAYHRRSKRDESIKNAASHLEQALKIHASEQPETADTNLLGIGGGYEVLGELSENDKCQYFSKARKAFQDQWPLIQGDSYTAYGHTTPLEPLRVDVRKHLASVEEKSTQAGCNVP